MIRFRPALLLVFVVVLSSCAAVQEQLPIPAPTTSFGTAEAAFNILIERHVDKPSSTQLLNSAIDAVATLLVKMNDPSPQVAKPTFTKVAPIDLRHEIATTCDAVIEALAD